MCPDLKYLNFFVNFEQQAFFSPQESFNLKRVRDLFDLLDIPYKKLKAIHIAGTKGKGSVASFCADLLAGSGLRVGLYTSPHFFDLRERIRVRFEDKDELILEEDLSRIIEEFKSKLDSLTSDRPTFFEVVTAIAFKYFLDTKVDYVVIETGLGGRLDATNVIEPLVSVITHIGYDHTDKLGESLVQIASEKAGIIKKGVSVVSAAQVEDVYQVIKDRCESKESKLFSLGKEFKVDNLRLNKDGSLFDFIMGDLVMSDVKLEALGRYQVENTALALAVINLLGIKRGPGLDPVPFFALPGRFELISAMPLIVVDVAHNPSSFRALAENLKLYYPKKRVILIFAAAKDKDVKGMLAEINYSELVLTTFSSPRAFKVKDLRLASGVGQAIEVKDVREALSIAKGLYNKDSLILVAGSFHLVAAAKK